MKILDIIDKYNKCPYGTLEPSSNKPLVGDIRRAKEHIVLVVDVNKELSIVMPLIEAEYASNQDIILPENMLQPFSQQAVASTMVFTMMTSDLGRDFGRLGKKHEKYFKYCVDSAFGRPNDEAEIGKPYFGKDDPRLLFHDDLITWINPLVNKAMENCCKASKDNA